MGATAVTVARAVSGRWSAQSGYERKLYLDAGEGRSRGWVFKCRKRRVPARGWCLPEMMVAAVKDGSPDLTEADGYPDLTEKVSGVGMVVARDVYDYGPDLYVGKLCECFFLLSSGCGTATEPP